jgi:CheY-like chemotaxis protein
VLIAEDHPEVAKAVCRVLSLDCDVVGTVADGSAVLEAAQGLQPDVIVVDLDLPGVNGLEVCRQIVQVNPEAKVIVFSAMNDPDVRQRSFEVGASAFVSKLGDDGNLLSTIQPCVTTEADAGGPDSTGTFGVAVVRSKRCDRNHDHERKGPMARVIEKAGAICEHVALPG